MGEAHRLVTKKSLPLVLFVDTRLSEGPVRQSSTWNIHLPSLHTTQKMTRPFAGVKLLQGLTTNGWPRFIQETWLCETLSLNSLRSQSSCNCGESNQPQAAQWRER